MPPTGVGPYVLLVGPVPELHLVDPEHHLAGAVRTSEHSSIWRVGPQLSVIWPPLAPGRPYLRQPSRIPISGQTASASAAAAAAAGRGSAGPTIYGRIPVKNGFIGRNRFAGLNPEIGAILAQFSGSGGAPSEEVSRSRHPPFAGVVYSHPPGLRPPRRARGCRKPGSVDNDGGFFLCRRPGGSDGAVPATTAFYYGGNGRGM